MSHLQRRVDLDESLGSYWNLFKIILEARWKRSFSAITPTACLQNLRFSADDRKSKETGTTNEKPWLSTIKNWQNFWRGNCLLISMETWASCNFKATQNSPVSISSIKEDSLIYDLCNVQMTVKHAILLSRKYTANRYQLNINFSLNLTT